MPILIDTHAFIWFALRDRRLSAAARERIAVDPRPILSVASLWEIAIKTRLGRLHWEQPLENLVAEARERHGFVLLDVRPEHAFAVAELPRHHGDPFDLALIAQARVERLPLVSRDPFFARYGVEVIW